MVVNLALRARCRRCAGWINHELAKLPNRRTCPGERAEPQWHESSPTKADPSDQDLDMAARVLVGTVRAVAGEKLLHFCEPRPISLMDGDIAEVVGAARVRATQDPDGATRILMDVAWSQAAKRNR